MNTKNLIICALVIAVLLLYFYSKNMNESFGGSQLQLEDQIQKSIMRWKMEQAKGS